ncbi:MAG: DUF1456 family protein [Rhodobacterales bacterium]|nr:DUF1456 family protein [Rhodobacterales bacterium]
MNNNDILRRIRYALKLSDARMVKIFALVGEDISAEEARAIVGREEDADSIFCTNDRLSLFLDGLIIDRRGPRKPGSPIPKAELELTNNDILKKLRIALTLREPDILQLLADGDHKMSKSELGALFRKPDHKHYREAGNQVLRKFLRGLTLRLRPASPK